MCVNRSVCRWVVVLVVGMGVAVAWGQVTPGDPGERLGPEAFGPGVIEEWEDALVREQSIPKRPPARLRNGQQGGWVVPSRRDTFYPSSGEHNVINQWGDTLMGIGFPEVVDVHGAFFAGQAESGVWTTGIRVHGYRNGQVVQQTEWFRNIGKKPKWFAMNLRGVDRIVIESEPVLNGGGWYGMDDLTYSRHSSGFVRADEMVVVDFEDVGYRVTLSGTNYAGLTWETGQGKFEGPIGIHPPQVPAGVERPIEQPEEGEPPSPLDGGTAPTLGLNFVAADLNDGNAYPPDTMGAIGQDYYVEVVNQHMSVYNRDTGQRMSGTSLEAFFGVSGSTIGDPRVVWDHHAGRWIIIATTFDDPSRKARIYFAVSKTASPLFGGWYKNYIQTDQGADAGKWPDFPTLGYDMRGIYIASAMIGTMGGTMTIWALDKAPLIANPPSLGTVTVWRSRPWGWAIQPAHTYGDPGAEYLLSRANEVYLQIRRIVPPLTAPVLQEVGYVSVPYHTDPPSAPALGSATPIDTGDTRPQETTYRNGSLWTCQTVAYASRAACRWYQISVSPSLSVVQAGTVWDSNMYYYYPSIMVNSQGEVVMGFSGSNASQYVATYYTGRLPSDPPNEMATPQLMKAGEGPYTVVFGGGRNRWGDYSATRLDPRDETTFWTIQEYGKAPSDRWGTWVGVLSFPAPEQACCYPSGICLNQLPATCTAQGGQPQGSGTTCASFNCPPCRGDLNCDGQINLADINPFVMALTNPAGWQAQYPGCPVLNGDINQDQTVNFNDINPFVSLLASAGGQPIPCP